MLNIRRTVLSLTCLLLAACSTVAVTGRKQFTMYSDADMLVREIGEHLPEALQYYKPE